MVADVFSLDSWVNDKDMNLIRFGVRNYDPQTGMPIEEWKSKWEYGDVIDFGF